MNLDAPISYYNPRSGEIEVEAVYGEDFLRWAYGNPLGRLTVELAVKRAWFSRWYGRKMDKPASKAKVQPFLDEYGVDATEFAEPVESFKTFNEFFYRKLREEARPICSDEDWAVLPADGRHLAIPEVDSSDTFYIKGQKFDLSSFLADDVLAAEFTGGSMLISRLCPVDYHRYHFPVSGAAETPVLINGPLKSVSPLALRRNLSILWENKRSRTVVESSAFGRTVVMEIGATCVGSMHSTYQTGPVAKGQEKGYFSFGGSCIVTLFQAERVRFNQVLLEHSAEAREVYARIGEPVACLVSGQ